MKLFHISRSSMAYGETTDFIVRATDERRAREIAFKEGYQDEDWLNSKKSTCEPLLYRGEKGVILERFNSD